MKKLLITAAVLAAGTLLSTQSALALDLSKVKVVFSESINKDCLQPEGFDPALACFVNSYEKWSSSEALVVKPTIYLRVGIAPQLVPYAFMRSMGDYALSSYSDQELASVFNPLPTALKTAGIRSSAINAFAQWALGGKTTPAQAEFFKKALAK